METYDLVVIGGGSGGLTSAIMGARVGARVLLESQYPGCHDECVVRLLPVAKLGQSRERRVEQPRAVYRFLGVREDGLDSFDAEELPYLVSCFDDTVRVEKETIARGNGDPVDLTPLAKLGEQSDGFVPRYEPEAALFLSAIKEHRGMPTAHILDFPSLKVYRQTKEGDEHSKATEASIDETIQVVDDLARVLYLAQSVSDKAVHATRQKGRCQSMSHDIADAQEETIGVAFVDRGVVATQQVHLAIPRVDVNPFRDKTLGQKTAVNATSQFQVLP